MKRLAWSFLVCGCGFTDSGDGTKTLTLDDAYIEYSIAAGETSARLTVTRDRNPVDGAKVTLRDDDSDSTLTLEHVDAGLYQGTRPGFVRRWHLLIEAGEDELDAAIEAPGPFELSAPASGTTLSAATLESGLDVVWVTEDGIEAQEVRISLPDTGFDTVALDKGSFTIQLGFLTVGPQAIRVVRRNRIERLAGAFGISPLEVGTVAENTVVVE